MRLMPGLRSWVGSMGIGDHVTIRIDVDDDGKTDAKIPLKWAIIVGGVLLAACPLTRGLL